MAEKIIQNPSLTPADFTYDPQTNYISAIAGHPLAGNGGGTIEKSDLMWKPKVGADGYVRWELTTSATTPEAAYISGAQGPAGQDGAQGEPGEDACPITAASAELEDGVHVTISYTSGGNALTEFDIYNGYDGNDGKTPEFRINPSNAEWQWKYSGDAEWINLGVTASGAVGPQGDPCLSAWKPTVSNAGILTWEMTENTTDPGRYTIPSGISLSAASVENSPERKTTVQIWEKGASTFDTSFDLPWGQDGAPGFSPTITTATTADAQHPQSGVNVTVTDIDGNKSFNIWNGIDGQGATVNLLEGNGIQITHNGIDYTIGVSADYALKSDLPDVSDMATETWVGEQGFLKNSDLTDYATKAYAKTASANAYNEAVAQIPDVTDFITKDADDLTYYYKKTETSAKEELSAEFVNKVNKPDTSLTDKYLVLRTDTNGAISGWCDYNDKIYSKSESDGRYMQKNTDSTLSGDGTTNNPLGLDVTDAYTIDAINGITAVPDATSNKVIVKMTDDAWGYYQHLATSASEWDKITGLSAKSNVNITSAGVTTVTNTSGTTENKFTQYAEVASHPTPRMFLCATADTVADITSVLTAASGMGAVIFVIEPHS